MLTGFWNATTTRTTSAETASACRWSGGSQREFSTVAQSEQNQRVDRRRTGWTAYKSPPTPLMLVSPWRPYRRRAPPSVLRRGSRDRGRAWSPCRDPVPRRVPRRASGGALRRARACSLPAVRGQPPASRALAWRLFELIRPSIDSQRSKRLNLSAGYNPQGSPVNKEGDAVSMKTDECVIDSS